MTAASCAPGWLVVCGVTYGTVQSFTESKQGDSKPFIWICETTPLQQSDINNNHNSHIHTCTHVHNARGNLLKWNTQSLTFTSVRPYSFDRKRIQTEWNHHQHGCCAIDLSSRLCSLTDRGENWRGGLDWTQSLCFCLYTGLPEWHREREAEKEERHQLQSKEMKRGWHGSELPHNNAD